MRLERRERKLKASVDGAQATAAAAEKALNEVAKAAAEAKSQAQAEQGKKQVMLFAQWGTMLNLMMSKFSPVGS